MKFIDKLKYAIAERAAEAVAASLTILLVWAAYQMAPAVLPAIEAVVSTQVLLALLVSSVVLNFAFLLAIWLTSKSDALRLKYGVYWDRQKNPHCHPAKSHFPLTTTIRIAALATIANRATRSTPSLTLMATKLSPHRHWESCRSSNGFKPTRFAPQTA